MSPNDSGGRNDETGHNVESAGNLERKKILVLIKTSPLPSPKYLETVCTAGVDEGGNWYRLYPIPFRHLSYLKQFKKFQWIEVTLGRVRSGSDDRKESRRPELDSLKLGKALLTSEKGWAERMTYVNPLVSESVEALQEDFRTDRTSLGVIKPVSFDFVAEKTTGEWSGGKAKALAQLPLFGPQPKELNKVPYTFSYVFKCQNPECHSHKMSILDWEIHALYYGLKTKYGYAQDVILEKIKSKYLGHELKVARQPYFFLGTVHPQYKQPHFCINGVMWPPNS